MDADRRERRQRRTFPTANLRGFTLIEILIVIAILAILIALLFPALAASRRSARQAACISNLHHLGAAVGLYLQDADSVYPWAINPADADHPAERWPDDPEFVAAIEAGKIGQLPVALRPYRSAPDLFHCPADTGLQYADPFPGWLLEAPESAFSSFSTSYFYRSVLAQQHLTMAQIASPAESAILLDAGGQWHGAKREDIQPDSYRYNTLFADLHVRNISHADLARAYPISH